jgi:hypothetical protein
VADRLDCRLTGLSRLRRSAQAERTAGRTADPACLIGTWVSFSCATAGMSPAELRALAAAALRHAQHIERHRDLMTADAIRSGAA